jgi:hypothetical protein
MLLGGGKKANNKTLTANIIFIAPTKVLTIIILLVEIVHEM